MKKIFIISIAFFLLPFVVISQGSTCNTSSPFCSNGLNPYPAGVNVPAPPAGNNYDCLFTQPNPAWFYISVTQNGSIDFVLNNTANLDIDFILWGPFPNLGAAISQCGNLGNGGASGLVADCSYSAAPIEPVTVANVVAGEVYILLVTNFSNQPTNIFATANAGSGDYACDCETQANFALAPSAFNDAVLIDTTQYGIDLSVCAGDRVGFTVDVRADSITDSLGIYLPNTDLGAIFGPGNVTVFGPLYPIPSRFDTANFIVFINTDPSHIGINNAVLSILNSGCVQDLNIQINVIGVEASSSDTTLCAGIAQNIPLTANTTAVSGGSYQWTQISGPLCSFSNDTIANPILSIPSSTQNGDSVRISIAFQSAPDSISGLSCASIDTITIYFVATLLNVDANASDFSLCQNGLGNPVQFTSTVSGPGIDSTLGVYSWTSTPSVFATQLNANNIQNPTGSIAGNPGDIAQFVVQYNYGACVGTDTLVLTFGNWVADVSPATATICPGQNTSLTASPGPSSCSPTYAISNIPYAPLTGNGINTGITCDDCLSSALPIGFSFDFFCSPQTQFLASSNGFITFDLASFSSGCCSGQTIPDPFDPNNLIAFAWEDLNPGSCGNISYFTTGTAPNRRLCVNYNNVCLFGSTQTVNGQIILYETTNVIEIHTTSIASNFNIMTQGIENAGGTVGYGVPGRVAADFTATNDAWRFTPQLTFLPTYSWSPNTNISATNTRNVTVNPNTNTTYFVSVTEGGCTMIDSAQISMSNGLNAPVIVCGNSTDSSVQFIWNTIPNAINYQYSTNGGSTWNNLTDTTVTLSGLNQGDTVNVLIRAISSNASCPFGPASPFACITQVLCNNPSINLSTTNNTLCVGTNAIVVFTSFSGGTLPYQLSFSNGVIDTVSSISDTLFNGLAAGNYTVTVTDLNTGCTGTTPFTFSIINNTIQPSVSFSITDNTICTGSNSIVIFTSFSGGTLPYQLSFSNGVIDTVASISDTLFNGLAAGNYTVTVTDLNTGCTGSNPVSFSINNNLVLPTANFSTADNSLCVGSNAFVTLTGIASGSFPFVYSVSSGLTDTVYALNDTIVRQIAAGNYTITITDISNGCSSNPISITINDISVDVSVEIIQTQFIACGDTTGAALNVNTVQGNPITFNWSNGLNGSSLNNLSYGTYYLSATDATGSCQGLDTITISYPFQPNLNAWIGQIGVDSSCILQGEQIGISSGVFENLVDYEWSPNRFISAFDSANTFIRGDSVGSFTYYISATSPDGCVTLDTIHLCVNPVGFKGMPSAFSPNGDGNNDIFGPVDLVGAEILSFDIYNRWGQKIYDAKTQGFWDGKVGGVLQPREVYLYVFEYMFPSDAQSRVLRGQVTLIR